MKDSFINEIFYAKLDLYRKSKIIDGRSISSDLLQYLKYRVQDFLSNYGIKPSLKVIMVGDDPVSKIYVKNKKKKAEEVGINCDIIFLPLTLSASQLYDIIEENNQKRDVHGIIVQLPLPKHIDVSEVMSRILPEKDVDGFNPINIGKLYSNYTNIPNIFDLNYETKTGFKKELKPFRDSYYHIPCTPLGCLYLLKTSIGDISSKNIVIIGRSNIVGRPVASLMLKSNATVTICHSHTTRLHEFTKNADIVITASGIPKKFTREYFNNNSVVIDVGISKDGSGKIFGDVDFEDVAPFVRKITPVPGGVGPMTVACLMLNTLSAASILVK